MFIEPLRPLWRYDPVDVTTWKYLTCTVKSPETGGSRMFIRWIANPKFKFNHIYKLRKY